MRVISGSAGKIKLLSPKDESVRPTLDRVKEGIFSSLHFDLPGARVLDLFAGSGALGIEALSRGAESCVFVDNRRENQKLIEENLRRTSLTERAKVYLGDAVAFLSKAADPFDFIFLDPPYDTSLLSDLMPKIPACLRDTGVAVVETDYMPSRYPGLFINKEFRYGSVYVTLYKKEENA